VRTILSLYADHYVYALAVIGVVAAIAAIIVGPAILKR
jgi:hypothetical protein